MSNGKYCMASPPDAIYRYLSGASETFVGYNDMGVAG